MKGLNYNNPLLLPRVSSFCCQPGFPAHAHPRASSHLTVPVSHQAETGLNQDKKKKVTERSAVPITKHRGQGKGLTMVSSRGSSAAGKNPSSLKPIRVSRDVPG